MNSNNPYGYFDNGPYNRGYNMPPKKTFFGRISEDIGKKSVRDLLMLGMLSGAAILLHLLFGQLYSLIIVSIDPLKNAYLNVREVGYLCDTMYTFFSIGLPFLLVLAVCRKTGLYKAPLPLSLNYDNSHPLMLIIAGLGVCYLSDIVSSFAMQIINAVGIEFYSTEYLTEMQSFAPENVTQLILMIVRTAIVPALIEEFAFRGVVMQPLRKYGDWFAIISSAFLFGLLHGNFMQIPFAFIAGVALGYVCVVTGSMWVSIALHLLNNLMSVVYSMLLTDTGDMLQLIIASSIIYGIAAIGVVFFVLYTRKNSSYRYLYGNRYYDMNGKARYYFLAPTLLFAIILMTVTALKDIKGIG